MKHKIPVRTDKNVPAKFYVMFGVLVFLVMALFGYALRGIQFVYAEEVSVLTEVRFNNDNIHTSVQPAPISSGYDFGTLSIIPLEDGKTLMVERYILEPEYGVSIFKYSLDEAFWYVTNKGVIYGENSVGFEPMASTPLQALSIYLTL